MKSLFHDRFLLGILIGIGVLIAVALILFSVKKGQESYIDDSTPAGALQNYLVAVRSGDYQRAYSYLADYEGKPDYAAFRQSFLTDQRDQIDRVAVEVGETIPGGDGQTAVVQVTLLRSSQDLFGDFNRQSDKATMALQSGSWKVMTAPYPYLPSYYYPQPPKIPSPTFTVYPTNTPAK